MLHFVRSSLLIQLLSVYLLFVIIVLVGGLGVNVVVEQQLRNDAQASDQALAQEVALQTSIQVQGAERSLVDLGNLVGSWLAPPPAYARQGARSRRQDDRTTERSRGYDILANP